MCVQILDLIRQPWGLGILLRAEFRAYNGVKFLKEGVHFFDFMHHRFHEVFHVMLKNPVSVDLRVNHISADSCTAT